ncbi:asparagine synthase (glutamine-hydrolyzing) [Proteinivorax hydrogeniformans]|uniref:asparagine synthase (glutamine-hydrolyzing) n=1 Tax=Proteinivorax hydrogeniformans TaxID=1826727 RepID=A0AAU8HS82_9FIRM
MCGINGLYFYNLRGKEAESLLRNMANTMIHRGPDDEGFFLNQRVGLSFRRLSIIDTTGASQPLTNERGNIKLVCNGEIYNYKELRKELSNKGHKFFTQGDAEVIIHLYEEHGKDLVNHLRGMFSFVLYDIEKDKIIACRDHFGIKPLYYTLNQDRFACSSELKSLLLTMPQKELDKESLSYYLTYQYVPLEKTMIKDVFKLLPGHRLIIDKNGITKEKYWSAEFSPKDKPVEQYKDEISHVIAQSVKVHMQSDVPIGAFLSSGVDSTAIAALMRQIKKINTFSVGFEGSQNECVYSSKTSKVLDTEHHKWIISEQEYFQSINDYIWFIDDPVADPSAIALYLVSKLASKHVKVVLSGEGADEFFAGYGIYKEPLALKRFDFVPKGIKKGLNRAIKPLFKFHGKNYLLRGTTELSNRFVGNAKIFVDDVKDVLIDPPSTYASPFELTKPFYETSSHLDPVKQMQTIDINFWLPGNILTKADKMSMANSIELRVPFLDIEVFKVASQIPTSHSINPNTTKAILRDALKNVVPEHIINRPKLGFPVPLAHWLRGKRGEHCISVIKSSGLEKVINLNYVQKLYNDHLSGKANNARKIWTLYILAMWHKKFLL